MLHYDFMQRAFYAGGLVALIASPLGVYLMLRRQALMTDTLSHVSLAGVAIGATLKLNPSITGFILAVLGAIGVEVVRRYYRAYSEMSIAIIMIGGLSLAVVLMSINQSINKGFMAYLFGSVVAVSETQLWMMLGVACIGGLYLFVLRRPLYQIAFDEETAKTNGLPVQWISFSFSILTGMVVAVAIPIVGVLLISSLVILPGALAIRLAAGFTAAIFMSMAIGLTGVYAGLTASYVFSTPPGGTIALVLLTILIIGIALKKAWMLVAKANNKKRVHEVSEQGFQPEGIRMMSEPR